MGSSLIFKQSNLTSCVLSNKIKHKHDTMQTKKKTSHIVRPSVNYFFDACYQILRNKSESLEDPTNLVLSNKREMMCQG